MVARSLLHELHLGSPFGGALHRGSIDTHDNSGGDEQQTDTVLKVELRNKLLVLGSDETVGGHW